MNRSLRINSCFQPRVYFPRTGFSFSQVGLTRFGGSPISS